MPFLAEDGTIVPNANSLVTVEFADDYFLLRGVAAWALLTQASKEASLVLATDYIQVRYGNRFTGSVVSPSQSLAFPRKYSSTGDTPIMPDALLKATAEYAIRASESPLQPDPILGADGRMPIKVVEEVGPIREEYAYSDTGNALPPLRSYPEADALIALLIYRGGGVVRA